MTQQWTQAAIGDDIMSQVDADRMWKMLEHFSTLNRDAGSADEHAACRYIADQLQSAGIPHELYEFQAYLSHPRSAGLTVFSPRYQAFQTLTHSFSGNTPPQGVSGEVVFIGSPAFEPGMEMDTRLFENLNLHGKIVLSEGLVRPWKATVAQARGAIALVNVNATDQRHNMIVSTAWGMPATDELHLIPTIPVISVNREDGQNLIRMCRQGRVEATVQAETDTGFFPLLVPVAKVEGQNPEDFILVHGHIDSWHVGITDNATGNATKLELARLFHAHRGRLKNSILFAWWPGHSTGRYAGSTWYSDQFWHSLYEHAMVDINVDSTGVRGASEIAPKQTYELEPFMEATVARFIAKDPDSRACRMAKLARQGRHADQSFWTNCGSNIRIDAMIPEGHSDRAKVGGGGGGWWWHTEHDTLDKADPVILGRDTRLLGLVIAGLANAPVLPMDHRRVAAAFVNRLTQLEKACGKAYDFSKPIAVARDLEKSCQALHERAEKARSAGDPAAREAVNRLMLKLNRELTPALLTDRHRYRHQPAQPNPDLPGLSIAARLASLDPSGTDAQFTLSQLKREENGLILALTKARRWIENGL